MPSKQVIAICEFFYLCIISALCDNCHDKLSTKGNMCKGVLRTGLTKLEIENLENVHTVYKQIFYNINTPVKWDKDLQILAQRWANQCKNYSDECRSSVKYKTVYQLVVEAGVEDKEGGNFLDLLRKFLWDLSAPDKKTKDFKYDIIDRVGCGFTKTGRRDCKYDPLAPVVQCRISYSSYLVCNYAATSETNKL